MCIDVRKQCECGTKIVQFHLRDNVMPPQVIVRLYCPDCPGNVPYRAESMLNDNGWIIEYDLDLAHGLAAQRLGMAPEDVTPAFLFDSGYACWLELYPGEREEIREEKQDLQRLLKVDQKAYLTAMHEWNIRRVEDLKRAGWRRCLHT